MKLRHLRFYPPGIHRTKDGHLRYHSPLEKRNKYVHRDVAETMIAETPYVVSSNFIPLPFEIHHIDFNKENNEPHNLLICPMEFHSYMTFDRHGNRRKTKFHPIYKQLSLLQDEVPF